MDLGFTSFIKIVCNSCIMYLFRTTSETVVLQKRHILVGIEKKCPAEEFIPLQDKLKSYCISYFFIFTYNLERLKLSNSAALVLLPSASSIAAKIISFSALSRSLL